MIKTLKPTFVNDGTLYFGVIKKNF